MMYPGSISPVKTLKITCLEKRKNKMERVDFWHEIENKFWLVARAKNPLCATYAHESKEAAFEEAERLAKKENDRFLVLECVGYCEIHTIRAGFFAD
jgi:hypothetical protein